MTAPGGGFNEGAHDDESGTRPAGGGATGQPEWTPPGEPATGYGQPPAAEYPPPAYPPPGHAAQYPPPMPPAAGYEPTPDYGGPPYQPGGYGPPHYPGGFYSAPDYGGGYGPAQPGMNGLAIGSLIASLTGFLCFIGGIMGIVLGIIALDQIKRTRQEGYGLAVAGIVIGIATLVVTLIVAIFALQSH